MAKIIPSKEIVERLNKSFGELRDTGLKPLALQKLFVGGYKRRFSSHDKEAIQNVIDALDNLKCDFESLNDEIIEAEQA